MSVLTDLSQSRKIGIDSLNEYCLIHIFEYLEAADRLKMELVSKEFNRVSKLSWSCMKTLDLFDISDILDTINENKIKKGTNLLINILQRCSPYLKSLEIHSFMLRSLDYKQFFQVLPTYCKNLEKLDLRDSSRKILTDEVLTFLFKNIKNLNSISLSSLEIRGDCFMYLCTDSVKEISISGLEIQRERYICNYLSKLKNLNTFELNVDITPELIDAISFSSCEDLREVLIIDTINRPINTDKFLSFLYKQKKLRKLTINGFDFTKSIMNNLPSENLEELKLAWNYIDPKDSCKVVLNSLPRFENLKMFDIHFHVMTNDLLLDLSKFVNENIKEIKLSFDNYKLTDEFKFSFKRLQNLEKCLILGNGYASNSEKILVALSACKNLKYLNLIKSEFKTSELKPIASLQNLKEIFLSGSLNFDENSFKNIFEMIIRNLPNLKVLIINLCKITNDFLKSVSEIKSKREDKHVLKIIIYCHGRKILNLDLKNLPPLIELDIQD